MMEKTALLVIDLQQALIEEQPIDKDNVIHRVNDMIDFSRSRSIEVIFVRHQDNQEGSPLVYDTIGW